MSNAERGIRYYHLPAWRGVELCLAQGVTGPTPPRFDDWLEIRLIRAGRAHVGLGRGIHEVRRGSLFVVPPREFCAVRAAVLAPLSFLGLCLDASRIPAPARAVAAPASPPIFTNGPLAQLLEEVGEAMTGLAPRSDPALLERLAAQLADLRLAARPGPAPADARALPPPAVQRALEYLGEHWPRDISLGELAALAGLSRYHFLRLFSAHLGVTPHRYQLLLRVAHARTLLRNGGGVADVALAAGFSDQSHLTRCFHSVMGVPPREFQHDLVPSPRNGFRAVR
jgi:AraC-like DNA-binding protein